MDRAVIARENEGEILDGKPKIPEGFVFDPTRFEQDTGIRGNLAAFVCGFDDVRVLPHKALALGEEDVKIQMKAVGICGSDIHYLKVVHPASLCHKLPDKVSLEEGAMCEPLSVGVHACRRAGIQAGTHVLILGTGPIGLVTMLVARVFGAVRVVVTDIDEKRLSTAKELGADSTILVSSDMNDLNDEVQAMQIAMEAPIDVTFDCVGTTKTMTTALNTTRSGGKVCLVGMHDDKMTLPLTAAAAREVDVLGIFRHRNTYKLCIELLQSKKIDIQKLITHRFGFSQDEVIKGFKANAAGGNVIKVMFNL